MLATAMRYGEIRDAIQRTGYVEVRQLPTGEWAGIKNLLYHVAICVGMKPGNAHTAMFCFDTWSEATCSLDRWSGEGFPPGYKARGL